jgi:diacylglycerol kinase family enzyme
VRLALVGNPDSGGGGDPAVLASRLRGDGHDVTEVPIHDIPERLTGAVDRVVVAGGDGSVGPAAALAWRHDVPLAVVPAGTANDFARALGLPEDEDDALALAARADARTRRIDLADNEGRPWVNTAAAGLSVLAARSAEPLKPRLGPLAYLAGALRAGVAARAFEVEVTADADVVFAGRAWQVVVAQTGAFGGGSEIGAADDADGALDVVVLPAGSRLSLVRRAHGLRTGRIAAQDGVPHARGGEIGVRGPVAFNIDGEVCEPGPRARFTLRGRVAVVVGP